MHCQKWGQDVVTSATTQYQLWLGAGLVLINFPVILITIFLFSITAGQTIFKTPTFGNAKRCIGHNRTVKNFEDNDETIKH